MRVPGSALCLAGMLAAAPAVLADVTTEQKLTMSLGGSFDIGVDTTEYTTADKQRTDSQLHCSGSCRCSARTATARRSLDSTAA